MTITYKFLSNGAADLEYLDSLLLLAERAQAGGASPWLYPAANDFYQNNLKGHTFNVAAFDGNLMVGYGALRHLVNWPDYLGEPLFLPEQCGLMLVNLVDPAYRGRGVGRELARLRLEFAKSLGCQHLYVTVHPANEASVRVLEGLGFETLDEREIFTEKLLRRIMYMSLSQ